MADTLCLPHILVIGDCHRDMIARAGHAPGPGDALTAAYVSGMVACKGAQKGFARAVEEAACHSTGGVDG